jgi:tagatose-1,6-bisphosphate aldolase
MQWVLDHDKEAQQIAHRGGLWMKDMLYHPDAATDDQAVYKEILRRCQSHFRASDKLL